MNKVYRDIVLSRVQAAIGAARAVTGVGHKGLKGQLREILVKDLFPPLLPTDIGLGTREIVTEDDHHSDQQDIVMYDRRILPPVTLEQTTGIFPIESVLYAIEVKSILTAAELRSSHASATALSHLTYGPGKFDEDDQPICTEVAKLIYTVFAFGTDLRVHEKSDLDRYCEILSGEPPAIKAICVVGSGYWYWSPKKGGWLGGGFAAPPLNEISEVRPSGWTDGIRRTLSYVQRGAQHVRTS